jgi:hypothetical protein
MSTISKHIVEVYDTRILSSIFVPALIFEGILKVPLKFFIRVLIKLKPIPFLTCVQFASKPIPLSIILMPIVLLLWFS